MIYRSKHMKRGRASQLNIEIIRLIPNTLQLALAHIKGLWQGIEAKLAHMVDVIDEWIDNAIEKAERGIKHVRLWANNGCVALRRIRSRNRE